MHIKIGKLHICTDDCEVIRGYNAFRLTMKLAGDSQFSDKFKKSRKYRKWKKRYEDEKNE